MQAKNKMTSNFPATGPAHHKAIKDQQRQRCELKDDYDHENVEIEYVIENVLFERQEQEQHHHQHQHQHQHMQPSSDTIEYESLSDAYNSVLLNSCSCTMMTTTTNTTSSSTSSSVESGASRESACGTYTTCPHGGNYISLRTELVLNPERHSKDLIYECSVSCKCDPASCDNRLVQFGPRVGLEIIASKLLHKQYALRTNAPIPCGAFICEYAGELLTRTEAQRRMKDYERRRRVEHGGVVDVSEPMDCNKMNYVLCLNEYSLDGENASTSTPAASATEATATTRTKSLQQTFVDPRLRGNIGRYLNHSCQPNCEILSVRVDCPIPKIAIFAKRDIQAGEELCFHYGNGEGGGLDGDRGSVGGGGVRQSKSDANAMQVNKSTPCLCGSNNCENFLPNLEF